MKKRMVMIVCIIFIFCLINIISATHTLEIVGTDSTPPLINLIYPSNTTYNINVSTINYTYFDLSPGYCWYSNNSGVWNSTLVSYTENFTDAISVEGSNTWTVYCNDSSGNINSSSVTFIKDTSAPPIDNGNTGGGGGGGSAGSTSQFWKMTYNPVDSDLKNPTGYIKVLGASERIKFNILNSEHHVGIISISTNSDSAVIQIMSSPINVTFNLGEEKKFDLNNDGFYDLYVKLNSIVNKSANLTITQINEKLNSTIKNDSDSGNEINKNVNNSTNRSENKLKKSSNIPLILIVVIIVLVVLIIVVLLVIRFAYKSKRRVIR